MNIYLILILLGICCCILSFGFSKCEKIWGPWMMFSGIVGLLALIVWIIYCLILY